MPTWLLLRIPRTEGADVMSAVLGIDDRLITTTGPSIPKVCDDLIARAERPVTPVLIHPLDGRHDLAHIVLEEASRRGWEYSRHVPAGHEAQLLDLDGPDAAPGIAADQVSTHLDGLIAQIKEALESAEAGEAMAIARQALTVCLRHFDAWHPDTLWCASNLLQISISTGAPDNIRAACGLIAHLFAHSLPDNPSNALGTLRKLDEIARRCVAAERPDLAVLAFAQGTELARKTFGDDHPNTLGMQNNRCVFLGAIDHPDAEPELRKLLAAVRTTLGANHPNVAVVLMNLAEQVEKHGRPDEVAALRAEAASIRGE